MGFRKVNTCPHCAYECVTTGDNKGDVTSHGLHGAFFHMGDRMQRTAQYATTENATLWACPACTKTFIELPH